MKKVLLMSETYSGGVKTYIDTVFANGEKFKDINLTVLVSSARCDTPEEIHPAFFINDNLSFGKSPVKLVKAVAAVHGVIRKKEIDIIHANSTLAGLVMYGYSFF